jgi:hypothetical protein
MKKIILLSAITLITAMSINAVSAQGYKDDSHKITPHEIQLRDRSKYSNEKKVDELKREMDIDNKRHDRVAYNKHKQQLDECYRDANRGHIEARDGRY